MTYANILPGVFLCRPNRFIAHVEIDGRTEICHVKNTGRCQELLLPGARVYVQRATNPARKTKYDLISVYKGDTLVNIDSAAPNSVFREWAQAGGYWGKDLLIKPESRWGASRFDFYMEAGPKRIYVEVKGVTLEEKGIACFPDAPTERGVKHLRELISRREAGYDAAIVFVIQMKGVHSFRPNDRMHPAFGLALREAAALGVEVLALDCRVTSDGLWADSFIPVDLTAKEAKERGV